MPVKTISNARIILPNEEITGSLIIENGLIVDIVPGRIIPDSINLNKAYLAPGIIDIHSDHLEREISPRPNTRFPFSQAFQALDQRAVSSGITTLYNAISFFENKAKGRDAEIAFNICKVLDQAISEDRFQTKHYIHARLDTTNDQILEIIDQIVDIPYVRLAAYNDHTPGHRQYRNVENYITFTTKMFDRSVEEARESIKERQERALENSHVRDEIHQCLSKKNIIIGSHDDETIEHVDLAIKHGCHFCEFPITEEAARYIRKKGILISMGAPNLILGRSTSNNVSCRDLIKNDLVDIFCSDYHLPAMLQTAIYLMSQNTPSWKAFHYITRNPAKAVGMENITGSIEIGKKADLIAFNINDQIANLFMTMVDGKLAFAGKNFFELNNKI